MGEVSSSSLLQLNTCERTLMLEMILTVLESFYSESNKGVAVEKPNETPTFHRAMHSVAAVIVLTGQRGHLLCIR